MCFTFIFIIPQPNENFAFLKKLTKHKSRKHFIICILVVIPSRILLRMVYSNSIAAVRVCVRVHFSLLGKIQSKPSHACWSNFVHFISIVNGQIIFIFNNYVKYSLKYRTTLKIETLCTIWQKTLWYPLRESKHFKSTTWYFVQFRPCKDKKKTCFWNGELEWLKKAGDLVCLNLVKTSRCLKQISD